jgi:lactaldehyde dehydrogenase / glycolaldehyde dehydrogenase
MSSDIYIDGVWHEGRGTPIDVLDPSSEAVIATVAGASEKQAHEALAAARRAQSAWAQTPAPVRGELVREIADLLAAHADELAMLLVAEVGKPLRQAFAEVAFAERFLRYNAEWDLRLEGEILPGDVHGEAIHLLRAPVGVVAAICPWNFPLAVLCRKLAPALVVGNSIVIKPSEASPLSTLRLLRLIDGQLELPAGLLNLLPGAGDVGRSLVDSPLTSLVSFTGHRDTGKAVMARASRNLTRVALELGGKAPAIVWSDADLELAVPAIVAARHTNCGQACTAAERVLVHADLLQEFTERYVTAVESLTIGDPRGEIDLGPLATEAQLQKTEMAVRQALEEGASLASGGGRPSGTAYAKGYWHAPTVLTGVRPGAAVMSEETFGPVTPIVGVEDLGQALELANDSRYGLSAYLFSRDYQTLMQGVEGLQFGEIYVNRTLGESIHAHHSGYRESGIGGEDGKWGLLRYTQIKTVYHHFG